ncbi:hypothetical protein DERP_011337 [Dermatophagoides pteronyssinus]|uniref:Uncharacterized protein n=1 Tax=Dermatophagoides pteronyssinus TaxID=6956 RepID=A0ABQ8J7F3_DERPT|nr:hypothetical protein DERP_011337 [Dermatophagoides pteronyssinus]
MDIKQTHDGITLNCKMFIVHYNQRLVYKNWAWNECEMDTNSKPSDLERERKIPEAKEKTVTTPN